MSKVLLTFPLCYLVCVCVCVCVVRESFISGEKNPDFSLLVTLTLRFTGPFEKVGKYAS